MSSHIPSIASVLPFFFHFISVNFILFPFFLRFLSFFQFQHEFAIIEKTLIYIWCERDGTLFELAFELVLFFFEAHSTHVLSALARHSISISELLSSFFLSSFVRRGIQKQKLYCKHFYAFIESPLIFLFLYICVHVFNITNKCAKYLSSFCLKIKRSTKNCEIVESKTKTKYRLTWNVKEFLSTK